MSTVKYKHSFTHCVPLRYPFELYQMGMREGDEERKFLVDTDNNILTEMFVTLVVSKPVKFIHFTHRFKL